MGNDNFDLSKHVDKMGCLVPVTAVGKSAVAEVGDIVMVELLGGYHAGNVVYTKSQWEAFEKWLPIDGEEPEHELAKAMNRRDLSRFVDVHGRRLMAFLAGRRLLEKGRDPVLTLAELLEEYLEEEVVDFTKGDFDETRDTD